MDMILGIRRFGHAGEHALNEIHPGGFAHYRQSIRVVQVLEKNGEGLNLTWEVRDGILNHRLSGKPATLEGQIVRFSDKIAYIHHDMDDAQRAGILTEDDIPVTLRILLGYTTRERLNTFVHDIIENSLGRDHIEMSGEIFEALMKSSVAYVPECIYASGGKERRAESNQNAHEIIRILY